jgi:hypothetical protein
LLLDRLAELTGVATRTAQIVIGEWLPPRGEGSRDRLLRAMDAARLPDGDDYAMHNPELIGTILRGSRPDSRVGRIASAAVLLGHPRCARGAPAELLRMVSSRNSTYCKFDPRMMALTSAEHSAPKIWTTKGSLPAAGVPVPWLRYPARYDGFVAGRVWVSVYAPICRPRARPASWSSRVWTPA